MIIEEEKKKETKTLSIDRVRDYYLDYHWIQKYLLG